MEKMDQEIKQKWIEALRSGKYEQGKKYLKSKNKFCVLGVLCDISSMGEWKPHKKNPPIDKYVSLSEEKYFEVIYTIPYEFYKHVKTWLVPEKIEEYFSLERLDEFDQNGLIYQPHGCTLAHLNDCGATFEELADLIERYL